MACSTVLSAGLGGLERVDVGGLGCGSGRDDLIGERLELVVLRDEVGLGVQLDQRTVLGGDQALGRRPLGTLADILGALDAQHLDGLVEIAVALGERVLAVEHAGAGQLPKSLDVGSGVVRHVAFPMSSSVRSGCPPRGCRARRHRRTQWTR